MSVGSMDWGFDKEMLVEEDFEELNLLDDLKDAPRLVLSKQEWRELQRP